MKTVKIQTIVPNHDNLYQKPYYKEIIELAVKIEALFKHNVQSEKIPVFTMMNHTYQTFNSFICSNEWSHIISLEAGYNPSRGEYGSYFVVNINNINFLNVSIDEQ